MSTPPDPEMSRAARLLRESDALLITAGAGMGVDSGLPDFRGRRGFGAPIPPCKARGSASAKLPTPPRSAPTRAAPGVFMVIVSISIAGRPHTPATAFL